MMLSLKYEVKVVFEASVSNPLPKNSGLIGEPCYPCLVFVKFCFVHSMIYLA
jgi:hypothetical protein